MVYPIYKRSVLPILRLFFKEITGVENIPKKGPFILTGNHESILDPLFAQSIIIPVTNSKIHFLAIKGRFWKLSGDTIAEKWMGCICLDKGKERALQQLLRLLKKDEIVAIAIGGSASLDGKLKKGKTGVVRLGLEAEVPIVPIGFIGTINIAPEGALIPRLKRAKVHIGKPICLDKYYKKNIDYKILRKLTDDVMRVISGLTGKHYDY